MRRRALTICWGLLLAGCQLYWTKPGATYADFTAAHQACLREVGVATPSDPDTVLVNPESYKTCLRASGCCPASAAARLAADRATPREEWAARKDDVPVLVVQGLADRL